MAPPPQIFDISVRELADFVHRRGDLSGGGGFRRSNRALEGIRGHKRIQQSRGGEYKSEVPVERIFTQAEVSLRLVGRVDGIIEGLCPLVEEIKTVEGRWSREADPVHFAQLRLYAGMLAPEKGWSHVSLQLTYLQLDSEETTTFREEASQEELVAFLNTTLQEWFSWLLPHVQWIKERNASIEKAAFPFTDFRAGQRDLAKTVYRSIRNKINLFVEAPTGMGKTLATLFPAVKSLPLLGDGKIFYLTAKTPGRLVAQDGLDRLRERDVHHRSVSLTAKANICFADNTAGCDPATCPFTQGYYDRFKPAMRELLETEKMDQETIIRVARSHRVCPFELTLDVSAWVDVIIGDYNYVFDPSVMLQRYFGEGKARHVVLVDEAHNLVDRSRDMYSASLTLDELSIPGDIPGGKGSGRARKALARARKEFLSVLEHAVEGVIPAKPYHHTAIATASLPDELMAHLTAAGTEIESFLASQPPREDLAPWLDCWFAIYRIRQVSELFDVSYRTIVDPANQAIKLFCLDPSRHLAETLKGLRCAVFFSGTLAPMEYFKDVLGRKLEDAQSISASPFKPEQMTIQIAPLDISFQARDRTLDSVCQAVQEHVRQSPGNHLIFCPSLSYLEQLHGKLTAQGHDWHRQKPAMNESERDEFLARFTNGSVSVGLAVLGGIFSEGIDLPGNRLVGVTIIGVGLPGLSLERDLLAAYFDQQGKSGFDYAYRFPGMQRVLQAAGRLIRSETDQGSALLIDRRYLETRYERLFPSWWHVETLV
ncbi:MAG TPA: helicase C-terminal domain-containing protein [Candidatus Methylacidiphilales bacterium]